MVVSTAVISSGSIPTSSSSAVDVMTTARVAFAANTSAAKLDFLKGLEKRKEKVRSDHDA